MASTDQNSNQAVSLDPVLTQGIQAPSPQEEKQTSIAQDRGVLQRIAQADAAGPTSRQKTQSEVIDLSLLQHRLGNPYSIRWIPYEQLREMTTDLMLAFGWWMTITPLARAEYYIECPDAQLAAAVDEAQRQVNTQDILAFSNALWYGHQPLVKRFKLGRLGGTYRDPTGVDPNKDIAVWNSSADALLWKEMSVLNPAHCLPQWNEDGEMVGFKFSQTPIPHFDLISAASSYGYMTIPGHVIGPEYAMWITNEQQLSFGSVFGSARTKRAYPYWWSYWFRWRLADRSYENLADPAKLVYYPVDFDQFIDPDDPNAVNPQIHQARQTALDLGSQTRSGATLAVPASMVEGRDGSVTSLRKWEIQYLAAKNNFSDLDATFKALDVQKLRSWFVPEQAFIEGCLRKTTPILCPRDHQLYPDGVPLHEIKPGQLLWSYNEESKRFQLTPVKSVHPTKVAVTLRVVLDDGSEVVGTEEHPFLMRDGSWKELKDLRPGDSLMPLYEKISDSYYNKFPCKQGDCEPYVAVGKRGGYVPEFRAVGDHFGWTKMGRDNHIHHKDERHANSAVENLCFVTNSEHQKIHLSDPKKIALLQVEGKAAIERFKASMTVEEWSAHCSARIGKAWANGRQMPTWANKMCAVCGEEFQLTSARQKYCDDHSPKKQKLKYAYQGRTKRVSNFTPKVCTDCDNGFVPTGSCQKRCQTCRQERIEPRYRRQADLAPVNHKVVSVEFCGIEEVWDIEMDAPPECHNFVAAGVVVHNSGSKTSGGSGGGTGGARMATQLGQVYEESQQLLVNQYDAYINDHKIPQFIAANFPEKIGTPCRKVSRSLGVLDDQTRSQILQLIGQVRGEVIPVDIRALLEQMNVPLLNQSQFKKEVQEIAELQELMGPPQTEPQKVGTQGYNAGVMKTEKGNMSYFTGPQRIVLAESDGFLNSLPETPHYKDMRVRSALIQLRRLFMDRYQEQYKSFADFLQGQPTLHLAENQQQQTQGLDKKQASAAATAIVALWASQHAPGAPGHPSQVVAAADSVGQKMADLVGKIALAGGINALKAARLDVDEFGSGAVTPWVQERVKFALDSIDSTVRDEALQWLAPELETSVDPATVAKAAEEHFSVFPGGHAERVVRTEAVEAFNRGTLEALNLAGVSQVQARDASDGTNTTTDAECLKRNGRVYSVGDAMEVQDHPNNTLYWVPLSTENLKLERVPELPSHLAAEGRNVAYDDRAETLYMIDTFDEKHEQAALILLGDQLVLG